MPTPPPNILPLVLILPTVMFPVVVIIPEPASMLPPVMLAVALILPLVIMLPPELMNPEAEILPEPGPLKIVKFPPAMLPVTDTTAPVKLAVFTIVVNMPLLAVILLVTDNVLVAALNINPPVVTLASCPLPAAPTITGYNVVVVVLLVAFIILPGPTIP